jgi:DNA-directed RNA polymerase specialized sigma24 family protein
MSSINIASPSLVFVPRQLSRRVRPDEVAQELAELTGHGKSFVLHRTMEEEKSAKLSLEALIAVLRSFATAGDLESAQAVFKTLVTRTSAVIANKLRIWTSIPSHQLEDVRQSLLVGLYEFVFSLDAGEELWECNFKTCFDCRFLTIIGKLTRGSVATVTMSQVLDEDDTRDLLEVEDTSAQIGFESIHVEEALKHLDCVDSRLGKSFYLKVFADLPEKEIAELMEVSERTVRNWIAASKKELREYFTE